MEYEAHGQVTVITGEGNQGQNILAMNSVGRALFIEGRTVFHNGCVRRTFQTLNNVGELNEALQDRVFTIEDSALSDTAKFEKLLRVASDESLFVLADGDCIPALVSPRLVSPEPRWLTICRNKGHAVVLTTVRGRETQLLEGMAYQEVAHIQVDADYPKRGLWLTVSAGKAGERVPLRKIFADKDTVEQWVYLADGLYRSPTREGGGLISVYERDPVIPVDYSAAVRSTETNMPQHPAYSFLLTQSALLDDNRRLRTTEMVGLPWNESVNKRGDEELAIGFVDWACEKWGIPLTDVRPNPASTYPDGYGKTTYGPVNIEVTKVQPAWPSGATFAALTAATREGKAVVPTKSPVISCSECGISDASDIDDVHCLPNHDPSHAWTCTYPKDMFGKDWVEHVTALPELVVGKSHLDQAIAKALGRKKGKPENFGKGELNWLVLIIEGFPFIPDWYEQIPEMAWPNFDAVFAVISTQFGSGIYYNEPVDTRRVVMVKCPEQSQHVCYHPGHILWIGKGGSDFEPLRAMDTSKSQGRSMQITSDDGEVLATNESATLFPTTERDVLNALGADRGRKEMLSTFRTGFR